MTINANAVRRKISQTHCS